MILIRAPNDRSFASDRAPTASSAVRERMARALTRLAAASLLACAADVACATPAPDGSTSDWVPDSDTGEFVVLADQVDGTGAAPALPLGVSGSAGSGSTGYGLEAGAAGAGDVPVVWPASLFCGDGIRDPETEECDDGPGSELDLCTDSCQVSDLLVEYQSPPEEELWEVSDRYLGEGRHPAAGLPDGMAVVYVEPGRGAAESAEIGLAVFDADGTPSLRTPISGGSIPVLFSNPVVAALPDGSLAAAWTDFDGDGDELGIALRRVDPSDPSGGSVTHANSETDFSQYDPDILTVGDQVVVAWTDDSDAHTGPDLRYRTFDAATLSATSAEQTLADTWDFEGNVSLAPSGSGWVAAWRASYEDDEGDVFETVEVEHPASGDRWSTTAHLAGAPEDHPAVAELDETHLLLVYTEGTDPENLGPANLGRLRLAVLDTAAPGEVVSDWLEPITEGYASDPAVAMSHPNAVRAGEYVYVSWRSGAPVDDPRGEDIWIARIEFDVGSGTVTLAPEEQHEIPRWPEEWPGDQRFPALAAAPYQNFGALALAWDDYGRVFGSEEGQPDVVVQFRPVPMQGFPPGYLDCSVSEPCEAGEGDCSSDDQCAEGLVCAEGLGPNFGWGPDVGICVPPHCNNDVQDQGETGIDCGGEDCGQCLCGDGVVQEFAGEECDDGGQTENCDADCTFPFCGDGIVNPLAYEVCDPGVTSNCLLNCQGFDTGSVCLSSTGCLKVIATPAGSVDDQDIKVNVKLRNLSDEAVPFDELTIRYWFTREGEDALQSACLWAHIFGGDSNNHCPWIDRSFTELDINANGASHYLELGFDTASNPAIPNQLSAGADTGDIQLQIHTQNWSTQDETNDHSYQPDPAGADAPFITLYRSGELIWGVEPGGSLTCGDGIVDLGEDCDTLGESSECDADCTAVECGDQHINPSAGETCDDGDGDDSDECPGSCTAATCGDGYHHIDEVCDPGIVLECRLDCAGYLPGSGCTDGDVCLKAQHRDGEGGATYVTYLRPYLQIVNNSSIPIALSRVTARYWYTRECTGWWWTCWNPMQTACDYFGSVGSENVVFSTTQLSETVPGADRYFEVSFTAGAGTLDPGESTGEGQLRLNNSNWSALDQSNDYSYRPETALVDSEVVTLYLDGQLVWGVEPDFPAACDDGEQNGNETDVDCGGSCEDCLPGEGCATGTDCTTGVCTGGICAEPSCTDGVHNGDETDVDCGGPTCGGCPSGSDCDEDADCLSQSCVDSHCAPSACTDGIQNGSETDVDCGGPTCPGCELGDACGSNGDCADGLCLGGLCQPASCGDNVRNGDETDVDCGGSCSPCPDEWSCDASSDCESRVCVDHVCVAATCFDNVKNGDESDVDCGGSGGCDRCAAGDACGTAADCQSQVCESEVCRAPTCNDGVENGAETGQDCGGTCGACPGEGCTSGADCASGICSSGSCVAPSCDDGIQNQDEADVDCGGSCPGCPDGGPCTLDEDCASGICDAGVCSTSSCNDGVRNGDESDVDCGGSCDRRCEAAHACNTGSDCVSQVCISGVCFLPTCTDGVENGSEVDVDCGGMCGPCGDGSPCNVVSDCTSRVCSGGICQPPTCDDGVQNQNETQVDCGGECLGCNGDACTTGSECVSGVCSGGTCEPPSCTDGVQNQDETDVDCGGNTCDPCADLLGCQQDSDCISLVCANEVCQEPTCGDNVENGTETDVDCGGGTCDPCGDLLGCQQDSDCTSLVCVNEVCLEPACDDSAKNGAETDVDCGGGTCSPCGDLLGCEQDSDCISLVCVNEVCLEPACDDSVQNGAETDVDCGGTCGPTCDEGQSCNGDADCISNYCVDDVCWAAPPPNIEVGGTATMNSCGPGSNTFAHPLAWGSGNDRIVLLGIVFRGDPVSLISVTYAGTPMTLLATELGMGGEGGVFLYYALDADLPSTPGTYTVNVVAPSQAWDCVADVSSYRYVRQAVPDTTTRSGGSGTYTGGLPSPVSGSLAYDFIGRAQGYATPGAGQILSTTAASSHIGGYASHKHCGSASPCQMTWILTSVNVHAWAMALLQPGGPSTCANGAEDGEETDVDCGGSVCDACPNGFTCAVDADCQTNNCISGTCVPPSCTDGVHNQDETDVDCGGSTCGACPAGSTCNVDSDCLSDDCTAGVCVAVSGCTEATATDLGERGIEMAVPNDGCVKVTQFPSWWAPVPPNLELGSTWSGSYPVPFSWSNTCSGSSGTGTFTADWQSQWLTNINKSCAVLIDLQGSGGTVRLRWY